MKIKHWNLIKGRGVDYCAVLVDWL